MCSFSGIASSFHGRINEIPGISADNFERPSETRARAYFLSHCHTDHTKGLFSTALIDTLEVTNAFIYMSELTAAIIDDEKNDDRIMKYIKPIKMGTTTIKLPSVPEQGLDSQYIDVTLIPAGHCFGSVMYLFETKTKTILFTGDFRMNSNDLSSYAAFHKKNMPISLDALYVDTTFMNESYSDFPKRSSSIEYAINEMSCWLRKGNRIALHTSAKYGYEFVFNQIYKELGLKVYVNDDRWSFYKTYTHLIPGVTNDDKSTTIHICRNRSDKYNHFKCIPNYSNEHKYLYVHFSAMKWTNLSFEDNVVCKPSENRLDICFPTHCSRNELIYFIKYLSPSKVEGFPNVIKDNICDRENVSRKRKMVVNNKVDVVCVDRKVDRKLLDKIFD